MKRTRQFAAIAVTVTILVSAPLLLAGCGTPGYCPNWPYIGCPTPPGAGTGSGGATTVAAANGAGGGSGTPAGLTQCDPCGDGFGGMLLAAGDPCGQWDNTTACCQGLTCVPDDPSSSALGTCQGTLTTCPPPTGSAGFGCDLPGEQRFACNISESAWPPEVVSLPESYTCGLMFCASNAANAKARAAMAAGVPATNNILQCLPMGSNPIDYAANYFAFGAAFNAPGAACVGAGPSGPGCDPCWGSFLSNAGLTNLPAQGEACGIPPVAGLPISFSIIRPCCSGLQCTYPAQSGTATCQGTMKCPPLAPNWQPLYTTLLRQIGIYNNVNNAFLKASGGPQNQAIGAAFETWALAQIKVLPAPPDRNTMSYISPARKYANMNNTPKPFFPQSVIPEFIGDQGLFTRSIFFEVKAVAGSLTLDYSQSQIRGLLDVADISTAKPPPAGQNPVVYFITTGNTSIPQETIDLGVTYGVGVWRQQVLYDANDTTPTNPMLQLGMPKCFSPSNLCQGDPSRPQGPPSRLAPAAAPDPAPDDPDPATIDG